MSWWNKSDDEVNRAAGFHGRGAQADRRTMNSRRRDLEVADLNKSAKRDKRKIKASTAKRAARIAEETSRTPAKPVPRCKTCGDPLGFMHRCKR